MSKSPGRITPSSRLRGSGAALTASAAHSTTPNVAGSAVSATCHRSSAVKQSCSPFSGTQAAAAISEMYPGTTVAGWVGSVGVAVTSASCRPGISRTLPT